MGIQVQEAQDLDESTQAAEETTLASLPTTPQSDPAIVQGLKALAHPIRLGIVQLLADKQVYGFDDETCCGAQEICVCKITDLFDVSMPTISHHLKLLREAGLVEARRDKVWIYYSLRRDALSQIGDLLSEIAGRGTQAR